MKKEEMEHFADKLSEQLDNLIKTIPGFLSLRFSGLDIRNKIELNIIGAEFMTIFSCSENVEIEKVVRNGLEWHHLRTSIGNLSVTCALTDAQYKQYFGEAKCPARSA